MKFNVYAIRDELTGFLTPTIDVNDGAAIRNFSHALQNPGTLFYTHAQDYTLMKIGTYDSDTGEIVGILPEVTILGIDVKNMEKKND